MSDKELYELVRDHLCGNLDAASGLYEVVLAGLPETLTDGEVAQCGSYLAVLLAVARQFVSGQRPPESQGMN